mmetsp:Transcript_38983/g.70964  ORF Transcript_38983/g.70964 Transcript_38983/m.70964 type:complete len:189 (-) Transcript_38983:123-689(-)
MGQACCCDVQPEGASLVAVSQAPVIDHNSEKLDEPSHETQDASAANGKQSSSEYFASPVPDPLPPPEATPPPPPPVAEAPVASVSEKGSNSSSKKFIVDVKTEGAGGKLGFAVGRRHGDDLLEVIKVADDGIVPAWNKANPEKAVVPGCTLLAINGGDVIGRDRDDVIRDIQAGMQATRLQMEFGKPT